MTTKHFHIISPLVVYHHIDGGSKQLKGFWNLHFLTDLTNPLMNPIPKLIGAGESTHNQDQSITEVSLRMTNNAVNRVINLLFISFVGGVILLPLEFG
jgi:hypothetical protein